MMELFTILDSERAPDTAAWQRALDSRRLPIRFNKEMNLEKARMLLPLMVAGCELEMSFARDDYAQLEAAYPRLARVKIREPTVYTLGYGRNLWESTAAFYLAAALVAEFGARAFEPQLGGFMTLQDLMESAEGCLFQALPRVNSAKLLQ